MPATDATTRFSSRVQDYVRYRPGYPLEIIDLLRNECGLTPHSLVVDIASGTGLFTKLLLENGNPVFAVEPNSDMRRAGEEFLDAYRRLTSLAGTAEATTLPDQSVDFVTAAQAAHWFDREKARREFARILKPAGWAVLIWNERLINAPFLRDYEQLLIDYGTDYQDVRHEHTTARMKDFFAPASFHAHTFDMRQEFDYTALEGRLRSSSYTPKSDDPRHGPMVRELKRIFESHQRDGKVTFAYTTRVFYGHLT